MTQLETIRLKIQAITIAFGDLHDSCPFTIPLDNGLVECGHHSAECIYPECLLEECPLVHNTTKVLQLMKNSPEATRTKHTPAAGTPPGHRQP